MIPLEALGGFFLFLAGEAGYIGLLLSSLFLWDIVDFYVELGTFRFLSSWIFAAFYLTRAFFCLLVFEIFFGLGIFNADLKFPVAFVLPLVFASVIQNLVVRIGATTDEPQKNVNLQDLFDRFKFKVQLDLRRREETAKVAIQHRVVKSSVTTEDIVRYLRLYMLEKECEELIASMKGWPEEKRRIEMVKMLEKRAGSLRPLQTILQERNNQRKG